MNRTAASPPCPSCGAATLAIVHPSAPHAADAPPCACCFWHSIDDDDDDDERYHEEQVDWDAVFDAAIEAARALGRTDLGSLGAIGDWTDLLEEVGLTWDPLLETGAPPPLLVAMLDRGHGGQAEIAGLRRLFIDAANAWGTLDSPFDAHHHTTALAREVQASAEYAIRIHAAQRTPDTARDLQSMVLWRAFDRLMPVDVLLSPWAALPIKTLH